MDVEMPAPDRSPQPVPAELHAQAPRRTLGLSRKAWWIVAAAFALGLLLFLALWFDQRSDRDFYRAGSPAPAADGQVFEPLPAPLPDGGDMGQAGMDQGAQDVQSLPPAPDVPGIADPAAPIAEQPLPSQATAEAGRRAPDVAPVPLDAPHPRYPPAALRRGDAGTVVLRVHVGPDGRPYAVDVVDSSRSRLLDGAAIDAVRRWSFRPALRNGEPVTGEVRVPITFSPR